MASLCTSGSKDSHWPFTTGSDTSLAPSWQIYNRKTCNVHAKYMRCTSWAPISSYKQSTCKVHAKYMSCSSWPPNSTYLQIYRRALYYHMQSTWAVLVGLPAPHICKSIAARSTISICSQPAHFWHLTSFDFRSSRSGQETFDLIDFSLSTLNLVSCHCSSS